jgi:hypothetical protein
MFCYDKTTKGRIFGAVYHITSRGKAREAIFPDGRDKKYFVFDINGSRAISKYKNFVAGWR